jgi:hypothetical protein
MQADAQLVNVPLRIGVMVHSRPRKFRFHLGFDLLPVFSAFKLEFAPAIATWAKSWIELNAFTVGTETSLGCEYLFSPRFGLSVDAIFTRCVFSEYNGKGKLLFSDPSGTATEKDYSFVEVSDSTSSYVTFMTDEDIEAVKAQGDAAGKAEVGLTGAGLKLTMRIYF